jgi:hypothetical protein
MQPASQQLIYPLSISLLEFNLKSYASAHSSAIPSEPAPNKYLRWLPIHTVTELAIYLVQTFKEKIIAAGGFEPDTAEAVIEKGDADAVALGGNSSQTLPSPSGYGLGFAVE